MLDIERLKPIHVTDLIRVGRDNDGGYIVPKSIILKSKSLLSYGINKDWSFEKDFISMNPKSKVHCYDHTLTFFSLIIYTFKSFLGVIFRALTLDKKRLTRSLDGVIIISDYSSFFKNNINHFQNRIWNNNDKNSVTIMETIEKIDSDGIFIKMDIEGTEYKVFNSLYNPGKSISGIAVEFHDIDKNSNEFNEILKEILKEYHIVHIHGNNYSNIIPQYNFPNTVEITFINKSYIKGEIRISESEYPIKNLDQPNRFSKPDYKLDFD